MYPVISKDEASTIFDDLFPGILLIVAILITITAVNLKKINQKIVVHEPVVSSLPAMKAQFVIPEKKPVPVPVPKIEQVKKEVRQVVEKKEVYDLTEKPLLAQKVDDIQENKQIQPDAKPVRKVYGLKKVYSQGFGAGGNLSDAVIGKIGNTINTVVDTFTATQEELKGQVVSTTTVTQAPRFKKVSKPEYTKEMIENRIEGVVKLKVLVDIDGKVKKATVISDIGFNSAQQALESTKEMEFIPAMRGEDAVAVWIIIPIKFVMLS
jgi:protein TonB